MTRPDVGIAIDVAPGVRQILAPNAGPMTHWGTNCFLVGESDLAVVDPGPDDAAHLEALMTAIGTRPVSHILVTHAHADHSSGAKALSRRTGAPICGFGPPDAGRRDIMVQLSKNGHLGGGEGLDHTFSPDIALNDGDQIKNPEWTLDVHHLPGHFAGHLGFSLGPIMFSGDHVMGWSSSIVSPPDGHLGDFLSTCRKLIRQSPELCLTGHGAPLHDPVERLEWLIDHRNMREAQILETLSEGACSVARIVSRVYPDIPQPIRPAAARNVLAHLIELSERKRVAAYPDLRSDAVFRLV